MPRPVPAKKTLICLPLPSGPRCMHNCVSRFTQFLPAPSFMWSDVFVWYVQHCPWHLSSGRRPPKLPRGVLGRPMCVVVRAPRCASLVPPLVSGESSLPTPCRAPLCPCSCVVQLWPGRAYTCRCLRAVRHFALVLLWSAALWCFWPLLVTASRWITFWKVTPVDVRLT